MSFENDKKTREVLKTLEAITAGKTLENKKQATRLMNRLDELLTENGLTHSQFKNGFGYQQIHIPNHDTEWKYSIICHPYSYGFPDALEIAWRTDDGDFDVKGCLSPEEVIQFIQEREKDYIDNLSSNREKE